MINIHRNLDDRSLDVQVSVGRTKSYINMGQGLPAAILEAMIQNSAEIMGGDAWIAIKDFRRKYESMQNLSAEMRRRLATVSVTDFLKQYEDLDEIPASVAKFLELERYLICKGVLTHAEIHWLDWFIRKHKLLGGVK